MDKITNLIALRWTIENCELPSEVRQKLENMAKSLERASEVPKKLTKAQVKNEENRKAYVEYINTHNHHNGITVGEIIKKCDKGLHKSNQYVASMLHVAVKLKEISKIIIKRQSYFVPYDQSLDTEN